MYGIIVLFKWFTTWAWEHCELPLNLHVKLHLCLHGIMKEEVTAIATLTPFEPYLHSIHSCPNVPLLATGCPKSHRVGGSHGETENEGWSETGEQHVMSGRRPHHDEIQMKDCVLLVASSLKSDPLNYWLCSPENKTRDRDLTLQHRKDHHDRIMSWGSFCHNHYIKTKGFGSKSEINTLNSSRCCSNEVC